MKQYQKKWLQHVQGMDTNRLPKKALQYTPKGQRNIGRPRKRWRDQLHVEDQGTRNTPTLQEHDDDDDDDEIREKHDNTGCRLPVAEKNMKVLILSSSCNVL